MATTSVWKTQRNVYDTAFESWKHELAIQERNKASAHKLGASQW